MSPRSVLRGVLAASAVVLASEGASAQVHWDASATAGPMLRVQDGGSLGAATQLAGHAALLPLLRAGLALYGDAESEGMGYAGAAARLKVLSPWPSGGTRLYLHAGFGGSLAKSLVERGPTGRFLEIPFGTGLQTRVWGPWDFVAELGVRYGFAYGGQAYRYDPGSSVVFALLLGVLYDR